MDDIMKKPKRVTRRKVQNKVQNRAPKKISRLQASASEGKRRPMLLPEEMEYYRPIKKPITVRLDADVLAWFQRHGRGYQTRINQALRRVMMDERKKSGD
jgi:uncharacterized protein (DUF4415 family)